MHPFFADYFVDPYSKEPLLLEIFEKNGNQIKEGILNLKIKFKLPKDLQDKISEKIKERIPKIKKIEFSEEITTGE